MQVDRIARDAQRRDEHIEDRVLHGVVQVLGLSWRDVGRRGYSERRGRCCRRSDALPDQAIALRHDDLLAERMRGLRREVDRAETFLRQQRAPAFGVKPGASLNAPLRILGERPAVDQAE
jgi:hypothetical protein